MLESVRGRTYPRAARRVALAFALAFALAVLAVVIGVAGSSPPGYPKPVPLRSAGLIGTHPGSFATVSPGDALGASYLPASNVLKLPDGRLLYLPPGSSGPVTAPLDDPGAKRAAAASREWLERGTVPGGTPEQRRMAERALLDLRLLTYPNGASIAAPNRRWDYVWPRDASWAAVAFAATGHHEESHEILEYLAGTQREDGLWEARYRTDGAPVLDGRSRQLDAAGWFPWAVWHSFATEPRRDLARERARALWPATRAAADAAASSLGPDGLPPGGPDYWEIRTWRPNLGTAAPLLAGLRSAAALARGLGHEAEARRYADAAVRLDAAIEREFAPNGYPRTTRPGSGADAAVNFLAPPFAPPDPDVQRAVEDAAKRLTAPNGGMLPGEDWPQDPTVAWTPETAFFALSAAAGGDGEAADRYLGWLADHRTSLGSFPEKVDGDGEPKAAAPLGWTSAIVLLALVAEEERVPEPPDPAR